MTKNSNALVPLRRNKSKDQPKDSVKMSLALNEARNIVTDGGFDRRFLEFSTELKAAIDRVIRLNNEYEVMKGTNFSNQKLLAEKLLDLIKAGQAVAEMRACWNEALEELVKPIVERILDRRDEMSRS